MPKKQNGLISPMSRKFTKIRNPINIINAKVCGDGCMYVCLLSFHAKTTGRISIKLST